MKAARSAEDLFADLIGAQKHIRARVAVKAKILAAVIPHSHLDGGGACLRISEQSVGVHTVCIEGAAQEPAKGIVANLADKRRRHSQPLQRHGNVGRRAAGRIDESRGVFERDIINGGNEFRSNSPMQMISAMTCPLIILCAAFDMSDQRVFCMRGYKSFRHPHIHIQENETWQPRSRMEGWLFALEAMLYN